MGNTITTNGQSATLNSRRSKSTLNSRKNGRNQAIDDSNQSPQQEPSRALYLLYFLNRTWNAMTDNINHGGRNGNNYDNNNIQERR